MNRSSVVYLFLEPDHIIRPAPILITWSDEKIKKADPAFCNYPPFC